VKKKFVQFLLVSLVCLFVVPPCFAASEQIHFKMVCSDTELNIGDTTTITVQAWVDSVLGTAGNGLDTWQMDLGVDTTGVIEVVDGGISLIAPNPDLGWSGWTSANSPVTGQIKEIAVTQIDMGSPSDIGIGLPDVETYSDIFSFEIRALAHGTAIYTIEDSGLFVFLSDGQWFENTGGADGGVYFDAAASDNIINVTPEPCSLMIMSGLSVLALRRRRHS